MFAGLKTSTVSMYYTHSQLAHEWNSIREKWIGHRELTTLRGKPSAFGMIVMLFSCLWYCTRLWFIVNSKSKTVGIICIIQLRAFTHTRLVRVILRFGNGVNRLVHCSIFSLYKSTTSFTRSKIILSSEKTSKRDIAFNWGVELLWGSKSMGGALINIPWKCQKTEAGSKTGISDRKTWPLSS